MISPEKIYAGRGCPICGRKKCDKARTKSNAKFLEQLKKINPNIEPLEEYKRHDIKMKFRCNVCNHEWLSIPDNIIHRGSCPACSKSKSSNLQMKSHEDFVNEILSINDNIVVLGRYTGAFEKIKCLCKIHNEVFYSPPTHMLEGKFGCKQCRSNKISSALIKKNEVFANELSEVHPHIKMVGRYRGANIKLGVKCDRCGTEWNTTPSSLLSGHGCPRCLLSKGELKISRYLDSSGISYTPQMKFRDLRGVGGKRHLPLSYDFYIPEYNLLIEYQGEFHDRTSNIQTAEMFEIQKKHDELKRKYAKDNNINLLEIWYKDYNNVEQILNECINSLKNPVTTTAV